MSNHFKTQRPDKRSDRIIIYELVRRAKPDTLFTYDDLIAALQPGVGAPIDLARVRTAVLAADKTLGREDHRHLIVVPGQGYRIAFAHEHSAIARDRQLRATRQIDRALIVLDETRLDELTEGELAYHTHKRMTLGSVQSHMHSLQRRRDRIDRIIATATDTVHRIEDVTPVLAAAD